MKHLLLIILLFSQLPGSGAAKEIEKKGYIITNSGDTIHGKVFLFTDFGHWNENQLFLQVRFADSTGAKKTYKPGDIRGYSLTLYTDTLYTHFISFSKVEMTGALGPKKQNAFLLRELTGQVEVYHLVHSVYNGNYYSDIPELYIRPNKQTISLARLKSIFLKIPMRYKRSDILPYLKDWPESEYSKIHEELSPFEVMECVSAYNNWWVNNKVNNQ